MKVWSLIWLSAMLTTATEAGRSRYVPNHGEIDHRELQSDNVRVIGKAYECTDNDFEIPEGDFRDYEPGDLVKFCIKPDIRSENRGIVMRSIDRMNLKGEGSGRTQRLIENKREKFTTLALCIPGQLVCSFRTRLSEELFWSAEGEDFVNITGVALVSMEYIDESFALNGVAASELPVDLRFTVRTVAAPPGEVLDGGSKSEDCDWWCQSPNWFKWLIILFLIIVLCCCCALCLTIPCVVKEMMDEDKDRKARRELVEERKLREQRSSYASSAPQQSYAAPQSFRASRAAPPQSQRSARPAQARGGPPRSQRSARPPQQSYRDQPQSQRSARPSQYRDQPQSQRSARPSQYQDY